MESSILEILSYVIVAITTLTMFFGVYAYRLYKIREKRVASYSLENPQEIKEDNFLYFEKKELLW